MTREAPVPDRLGEVAVARVVIASLVGTSNQVPPAYSAISVDGQRAYKRARSGEEVELTAREVTVYKAELLGIEDEEALVWDCSFHVSKGTYIRSIARDLGRSLGTAAHLCGLRRTASGPIGLESCTTIERLEAVGTTGVMSIALDPTCALQLPTHELNDYERDAVAVGRHFSCRELRDTNGVRRVPSEGERLSLVRDGKLMGVWVVREGRMSSVASFPEGIGGVRQ